MSVHDDLLEQEREDRRQRHERQRLITRWNIREALESLPQGHPAAQLLEEALSLLEDK